MIKRRFYKLERGDGDNASDSSSFSSDSELEPEASEESDDDAIAEGSDDDAIAEESEDDSIAELKEKNESCSTSSGYESEDSSGNEVNVNSAGLIDEGNVGTDSDTQLPNNSQLPHKHNVEVLEMKASNTARKEPLPADIPACMIKCKSVFKCWICPRIICLNEETMRAHVNSKRHARSEKLLKEGRLKAMLNGDGEIENQETGEGMHSPDLAAAQIRKSKGPRRQWRSSRMRKKKSIDNGGMKAIDKRPVKKGRKNED